MRVQHPSPGRAFESLSGPSRGRRWPRLELPRPPNTKTSSKIQGKANRRRFCSASSCASRTRRPRLPLSREILGDSSRFLEILGDSWRFFESHLQHAARGCRWPRRRTSSYRCRPAVTVTQSRPHLPSPHLHAPGHPTRRSHRLGSRRRRRRSRLGAHEALVVPRPGRQLAQAHSESLRVALSRPTRATRGTPVCVVVTWRARGPSH